MLNAIAQRRSRVASALNLKDEILLVGAGTPIPLPENSDQTYPFVAHADYFYLTEDHSVDGVLAYDPQQGKIEGWVHFVPAVSEGERVWEGKTQAPGRLLSELPAWLASRKGRRLVNLGAPLPSLTCDETAAEVLQPLFTHARRLKDSVEISRLEKAAAATACGYERIRDLMTPGISERALQIELEAEFFRHGADQTGFGTIVGSGPNSAVLHFSPSSRTLREGDFVLVDSGAQINRYTADVTRTFTVGKPDAFKKDLYQAVLRGQKRAIDSCRAGAEWKDVHLACAIDLVDGLISMGVMLGSAESLVEREAHALFFPHGLGHMVGLGVRDGSGLLPGRTKDPRPSLRSLRMDLPLLAGYVVTVEPGLYFIPPLLQDTARRSHFKDCVNWKLVDQHLETGGVRIEDDVLVTSGDPVVLTAAIPKEL